MRVFVLALSLLLASPALAQTPTFDDRKPVLASAVEVIRGAFNAFYEDAMELEAAMAHLCGEPSAATLEQAREAFRTQVLAYARVEFWKMGPLGDDNRADRILFWPDRKGIALKQIQAVLAEKDEADADPATIGGKSVAVQGLGALEFVLFGTGSDELLTSAGDFRCRYGHAIAGNLEQIGKELSDAWMADDGIAAHLRTPTPDNDDFRTETEALEGVVGAMSHGVEAIRDTRLQPVLGVNFDKPAPRSALFWRSGMTVPALAANFEGLAEMFGNTQIEQAVRPPDAWIGKSATFEFENAIKAADAVTAPIADALKDDKQHDALKYLVIVSQSLQKLIGENLSTALGLSVGFSALDGD